MLKIVAIMAVRNVAKTLPIVLQQYIDNQIDVHMIDNGSTDATPSIIQQHMNSPIVKVHHQEYSGSFKLESQMGLKQDIIATLDADWVMHVDGDEIFEPPELTDVPIRWFERILPWTQARETEQPRLRQFIEQCHHHGYDVIDCDEFVFVPNSDTDEPRDFVQGLRSYYYFAPPKRTLHRFQRVEGSLGGWAKTGGHRLDLKGRNLAPQRVRLRHYMGLSFDHLRAQYLGRVFSREDLLSGKHRKRVATTTEFIAHPDPKQLHNLDKDDWRTDSPLDTHLMFNQPKPYVVPKPLAPSSGRHRPFPFIVGVGRSGTTLLRMLVDAHPDIVITPETGWLMKLIRNLRAKSVDINKVREDILATPNWPDMNLGMATLNEILGAYDAQQPADTLRAIYQAYGRKHGVKRVGDKTPRHNLRMYQIASFLPEARFIHIIRDGRDVALSYQNVWFGPNDIREAAMFWIWRIREARQQAQFLPHYMEVQYEELILNTEDVLRQIGEFVELPYDPIQLENQLQADIRLKELKEVVRPQQTITVEERHEIHKLVSSPPDKSRIGRWKQEMSKEDLVLFERIAGGMLSDLGYERATDA